MNGNFNNKRIILASSSPRRRELMKLITDDFETTSADIDETVPEGMGAFDYPAYVSRKKAEAAIEKYGAEGVYIGCDTSVITDDRILFKPVDEDDAFRMLKKLSGAIHTVATGVSLIDSVTRKTDSFTTLTRVEFFMLDDNEICEYVKSGEPMDKAGAYGIQEKGGLFVKRIDGDVFNVIGLPIAMLSRRLKRFCL